MQSKKSFNGPPPGSFRRQSMSRASSVRSNTKSSTGAMARHGSVFYNNRDRETQVSVSTRGPMGDDEVEDLKQYYGDMAARQETRKMDGLKAVRSYRGDIGDGDDVGKPRRVTNRRSVGGRSSTGYGGINFKRKSAMRNGEQWGDVEIRTKEGDREEEDDYNDQAMPIPPPPMFPQQMFAPPMVMEEAPMMPQVFSQSEGRTYSNLSDAFSQDADPEEEDF